MKPQKLIYILIPLACFAFSPQMQAVVPPPDGGYPGFNTAEGTKALQSLSSGVANSGLGWYSLFSDSTASYNTGVGAGTLALNNADENTATGAGALFLNTSGTGNTASGAFALLSNDAGVANSASGDRALFSNTEGNFNTASGFFALHDNTTGSGNTANGASALQHNTTGGLNTAVGGNALFSNTEGTDNTATGANALSSNIAGSENTAVGAGALILNHVSENTAIGADALSADTDGAGNTATGVLALRDNIMGNDNTASGDRALLISNANHNTAVGAFSLSANTTGYSNTALGFAAGTSIVTANNVICIGASIAGADVDNSCYIGSIWQQPGGSQAVFVNSDGKLGAQVSSRRFKHDIKPMEQSSEVIYRLNPVSFRYNAEIEPTGPLAFGLIAEDVEHIDPDLVTRDKNGNAFSVRYDQVNAMLLNEFLKEHRKNEEQEATIARQQKQIDALTAGLQKVSAELKLNKRVPQLVASHRD